MLNSADFHSKSLLSIFKAFVGSTFPCIATVWPSNILAEPVGTSEYFIRVIQNYKGCGDKRCQQCEFLSVEDDALDDGTKRKQVQPPRPLIDDIRRCMILLNHSGNLLQSQTDKGINILVLSALLSLNRTRTQ